MCGTRRIRNPVWRVFIVIGMIVLGAACVPAQVPPQLAYTPGPPLIVAVQQIETEQFTAWLPPGWEVVTSAAASPQSVILISPDSVALIMLGGDGAQTPVLQVDGEVSTVQRRITLDNNISIIAVMLSSAEQEALYLSVFEQVVNSLRPRSSQDNLTN